MDPNPQDPIKFVFSHLNRVVLGLLTTCPNPDRQKIRATLDSEILRLSKAVEEICETTPDFPSPALARVENRTSQGFGTTDIAQDAFSFDPIRDTSWAQCDTVPSFTEQQQYQTPVSLQWSTSDVRHQISRIPNAPEQFTFWKPTPQPFPTTAADPNFPLNLSSNYLLSLGLHRVESRDSAATTIVQTDASSPSSGSNLTSLLDQTGFYPTCNLQQSYEEASNEFTESLDLGPGHEPSFEVRRASVSFVNAFTHGGSEQQAGATSQGSDGNQERGVVATSTTGREIEKLGEPRYGRLDRNSISYSTLPLDHLEVHKRLKQTINTDKDHVIELLTRLTYAIGSAESLIQLKTSVSFARQKEFVSQSSEYAPHDLAHTMRALDMLDTVSHHSSILRRYYLVRLLRHRLKCEADFHKQRDGSRHHDKKLKGIHGRAEIGIITSTRRDENKSNKQDLVHRKPTGHIRADSQALQDMMKALYPHLRPSSRNTEHDGVRQYERLLAKLKNRLACARNWHQFAEEYSAGILAVIPSGSRSGISSDQVEKLPAGVVASFLEFLRKTKGPFLKTIGLGLSEHIFEILCGNKNVPVYGLEACDEAAMLKGNENPRSLQNLCSVEKSDID